MSAGGLDRKGEPVGAGPRGARVAFGLLFAVVFLLGGIGGAVRYWTRDRSYVARFAAEQRIDKRAFHFPSGDRPVPPEQLLAIDADLRAYVLCACGERLDYRIEGEPFFNERERAHLRDVARVFLSLEWLTYLAPVLAAALALAGLFLAPRIVRRVALGEAIAFVIVAIVAALAFAPAFLLFHEVFFPQGNFLFDPTRDNLVLLYPEEYWLGVTLRIGATFISVALLFAVLASIPIRFGATE